MNTVNRVIVSFGRRRVLSAVVPGSYPMAREADRLPTDGVAVDAVMGVTPLNSGSEGWGSWLSSLMPSWVPTSPRHLEEAERSVLKYVRRPHDSQMVEVKPGLRLRTVIFPAKHNSASSSSSLEPLVMVHGFGGGLGMFAKNFDPLSEKRTLYAFDLPGFGRSSRDVVFPTDGDQVEKAFIDSIEGWRRKMGLEKFVLLGHSFGAYLSASYALQHPDKVRHLVLIDPWGFPTRTEQDIRQYQSYPWWIRAVAAAVNRGNPLAGLRVAGPLGPKVFGKLRGDLDRKFSDLLTDPEDAITGYLYHCNAQNPSGEIAFRRLNEPFTWARRPMLERIPAIDKDLPISFIFGSRTWMDQSVAEKTRILRPESSTNVHYIKGAGHHVYADQSDAFNSKVVEICAAVESGEDLKPTASGLRIVL